MAFVSGMCELRSDYLTFNYFAYLTFFLLSSSNACCVFRLYTTTEKRMSGHKAQEMPFLAQEQFP